MKIYLDKFYKHFLLAKFESIVISDSLRFIFLKKIFTDSHSELS